MLFSIRRDVITWEPRLLPARTHWMQMHLQDCVHPMALRLLSPTGSHRQHGNMEEQG